MNNTHVFLGLQLDRMNACWCNYAVKHLRFCGQFRNEECAQIEVKVTEIDTRFVPNLTKILPQFVTNAAHIGLNWRLQRSVKQCDLAKFWMWCHRFKPHPET